MGLLITKETDEGTVFNWIRSGEDDLVEDFKDFLRQKGNTNESIIFYINFQNSNILVSGENIYENIEQLKDYAKLALYFEKTYKDNSELINEINDEFPHKPLLFRFWNNLYETHQDIFKEVE